MDKIELLKLTKELFGEQPVLTLIENAQMLEKFLIKDCAREYIEELKNNQIFENFIKNLKLNEEIPEYKEYYNKILDIQEYYSFVFGKRRQGLTTFICLYSLFLICNNKNEDIAILNTNQTCSEYLKDIFLELYNSLNENLKPGLKKCNKNFIEFDNGCKIFFKIFNENSLKGLTLSHCFVDNFEFISFKDLENTIRCALPTMSTTKGKFLLFSTNENRKEQNIEFYEQFNNLKFI